MSIDMGGPLLDFSIDFAGLQTASAQVQALSGVFAAARVRAMKSLGFFVQQSMRAYIETGGAGAWPALHPLTTRYYKKRGAHGSWTRRGQARDDSHFYWLGKFVRYRVDKQGLQTEIGFDKSRQPDFENPFLGNVVRRAEEGEHIRVTAKMRRFFGATRRKRPKQQIPGTTYFPLKKGTTELIVPPRPIFRPVWRQVEPQLMALFETKFWGAVQHYQDQQKGK